jgi:hypothetical protein
MAASAGRDDAYGELSFSPNVIEEINTTDFRTETEHDLAALTVRLFGSAEANASSALDSFLGNVHSSAIAEKIPEVVVDMRSLDFMNSSCFKTFVSWVNKIRDVPDASQYQVRFVADEKKHWQNRRLGALACFATNLIRVES